RSAHSFPTRRSSDLVAQALSECGMAVNATTVGMTTPGTAFDVSLLPEDAAVFDLVYVPPVTELVEAATRRGLVTRNGLDMLVAQDRKSTRLNSSHVN